MIGKKRIQEELGNTASNEITVDGKKYYVLFNKAVEARKKGKWLKYIRRDIHKNGLLYDINGDTVFVTSDEDTYHKMQRVIEAFERLQKEPTFETAVQGFHFDFFVRSNVEYKGRLLSTIINIESTMYETGDNISSAEHVAQCITKADLVRMVPKKNCINTYILYLVFDEK